MTPQHRPRLQVCMAMAGVVGGSSVFFFTLLSHSPPLARELFTEPAPALFFQMLMKGGSEILKLDHWNKTCGV